MIRLESVMKGKKGMFGQLRMRLAEYGFCLCGAWEYDRGKFDVVLWREAGETIYLRMPFHVLSGELDRDDAAIEFRTPYIIKHVVNVGLDRDENSLLSATGFNQFQKPLDKDGKITHKDRWREYGEALVERIYAECF